MNRSFLQLIVAVYLAEMLVSAGIAAERPNIVVILTDDQGYADISLNPHHPKEVSTPHMDALAKDGVVFSQGYTSVLKTWGCGRDCFMQVLCRV